MNTWDISVTVNGSARRGAVEPRTLLSDFLRHHLRLTGTHVGCEQGACGSCTVLLDGSPVRSCLMFAVQADGQSVETVEGLTEGAELTGLQQAMIAEHGLQCGFCTPGILMTLTAADRARLTAEEAAGPQLGGHTCRCTGYAGIRAAVNSHWSQRDGRSSDEPAPR
ncbi:(2Fe-2S)-binding protein [Streptomyces sp. NPDC060035]|uniref:(2Fe-2S)-binding protein n=1 Tax=Streptomyces sp. NPDC060035 TaxID=3347044 RepID=UPI0036A14598